MTHSQPSGTADEDALRRPTIGYFPDYSRSNPYQSILYSDAVRLGVRTIAVPDPIHAAALADNGADLSQYALHIHWTTPLLQTAGGPLEALDRLDSFAAAVHDLRIRGGCLLWTVHNALPHECSFRTLEIELARLLADTSDVIHVMDESTPANLRDLYSLPADKIEFVPHPSYFGVYANTISRVHARERLGVLDHEVAVLVLGEIRPYKGLDVLIPAFDRAASNDHRLLLLVAGRLGKGPEVERLRSVLESHPRVRAQFGFVDPSDLQVWMNAADLMVLPYHAILNSGAFHLGLTFGLPVVAPGTGSIQHLDDPRYVRTFRPGSVESLTDAIRVAVAELVGSATARSAARAAAHAKAPPVVAAAFTDVLRRRTSLLAGPSRRS
jgi:glycosyltransferase involved in cell wall biosynthesis